MRFRWLLAIALSFCCRSALPQAMPDNSGSEYFQTIRCGALIDSKVQPAGIALYLDLKVKKPLPAKSVVVAEFENPLRRSAPFQVVSNPVSGKQEIALSSQGIACLTAGKYYRSIVTLFSDASRSKVLGTHVQIIAVSVPQSTLGTFNVLPCPVD